jgi:small-conductance mechanosensitive channel
VSLWGNRRLLEQTQRKAQDAADELTKRYQNLSQRLKGERRGLPTAPAGGQEGRGAALAALRAHIDWQRVLADLAKRIAAERQLAELLVKWVGIENNQIRVTIHSMFRSLLWILVLVFAVVLVEGAVERRLNSLGLERRRMGTMRMVLRFASRAIGVLLILLVLLGPPNQLSTIIAFAGAGLTVALKDFIVAFFGWFVLMGRNGIRVGDWVEINGIGGEVIEIGLLKTVLLETGNWNDAGHPTGRKVAFVNSFAMERHYFNFSTSGQWLWDELEVAVPSGKDPYLLMDALHQLVAEETRASVNQAEQEWQRATRNQSVQSFSAAPAIGIRPTSSGVSVVVRYITRANERHALRTRLYKAAVDLVHRPHVQATSGSADNAPRS